MNKLTSKRQVVTPESISDQRDLYTGDHFLAITEKSVVISKATVRPEQAEYGSLIKKYTKND